MLRAFTVIVLLLQLTHDVQMETERHIRGVNKLLEKLRQQDACDTCRACTLRRAVRREMIERLEEIEQQKTRIKQSLTKISPGKEISFVDDKMQINNNSNNITMQEAQLLIPAVHDPTYNNDNNNYGNNEDKGFGEHFYNTMNNMDNDTDENDQEYNTNATGKYCDNYKKNDPESVEIENNKTQCYEVTKQNGNLPEKYFLKGQNCNKNIEGNNNKSTEQTQSDVKCELNFDHVIQKNNKTEACCSTVERNNTKEQEIKAVNSKQCNVVPNEQEVLDDQENCAQDNKKVKIKNNEEFRRNDKNKKHRRHKKKKIRHKSREINVKKHSKSRNARVEGVNKIRQQSQGTSITINVNNPSRVSQSAQKQVGNPVRVVINVFPQGPADSESQTEEDDSEKPSDLSNQTSSDLSEGDLDDS